MSSYTLITPTDYVRDLATQIHSATYRVNMIALVIVDDSATKDIIKALCDASERGVRVSVGMDTYFTFKELSKSARGFSYFQSQLREMRKTKQRLERSGVSVRWLGQFGATLFSRRTHIKWSIVDDTVYSFGGINIHKNEMQNIDFIFKTDNQRLAERLSAEHELVISTDKAGRAYPSHTFGVDKGAVLIDGGRMFDSTIYKRACNLTEQAERVVFVSQYCPTGKLGRLLKHKPSKIYFNSWQNVDEKFSSLLIRISSFFHRIKTMYRGHRYVHAKFMIFYMIDGSKIALTGSHNFVASGGVLGTREVALETRDDSIISQLESFVQDSIER